MLAVADELAQPLEATVRDGVNEPEPLAVVEAVPLAVTVGVVVPLALRVTLTVALPVDVELPAGVDDEWVLHEHAGVNAVAHGVGA